MRETFFGEPATLEESGRGVVLASAVAMQASLTGPTLEHLDARLDVTFNWGYEQTRKELRDLYSKAKRSQWNAETDIDWTIDVDLEKQQAPEFMHPLFGSEIYARLTEAEKTKLGAELMAWTQSQFLHGEQGALLTASQLVNTVPDTSSKYYAATQVMDEARHVEVFDKYLHEKIGFSYPINPYLKTLLDLILKDSRWDMKFLGMQIMVEGLALAAFGLTQKTILEPLLKDVTSHVIRDEARHVAYGILSLRDHYDDMPQAEVREREDFVYEAARLMRDRFLYQEVWEKMGLPQEECCDITFNNESQRQFRQLLFARIVPAIKRIGLLSDRQRARFADLGILEYESYPVEMD